LPGTMKPLLLMALASAAGGVAGATVSEKLFGDATTSSAPWIVYIALASFGAGVIGTIFGSVLGKGEAGGLLGMLAVCSLLVGVAAGASARVRTLGASFLGAALGIGGFFFLAILLFVGVLSTASKGEHSATSVPSEVYMGVAVIAVGAGIVTLVGSLFGWAVVGSKRQ
jgi:hypothetical protein